MEVEVLHVSFGSGALTRGLPNVWYIRCIAEHVTKTMPHLHYQAVPLVEDELSFENQRWIVHTEEPGTHFSAR